MILELHDGNIRLVSHVQQLTYRIHSTVSERGGEWYYGGGIELINVWCTSVFTGGETCHVEYDGSVFTVIAQTRMYNIITTIDPNVSIIEHDIFNIHWTPRYHQQKSKYKWTKIPKVM
jgi:hypothetical protein